MHVVHWEASQICGPNEPTQIVLALMAQKKMWFQQSTSDLLVEDDASKQPLGAVTLHSAK